MSQGNGRGNEQSETTQKRLGKIIIGIVEKNEIRPTDRGNAAKPRNRIGPSIVSLREADHLLSRFGKIFDCHDGWPWHDDMHGMSPR